MATLSMADVLTAPEFIDQASYIRTTRVITTGGVAQDTVASPVTLVAIITSDGSTLDRLPDGSRLGGSVLIFTQTFLTDGLKLDDINSIEADIVLWHGRQYVVKAVQDFDTFSGMAGAGIGNAFGPGIVIGGTGLGYIVASADLLPLNAAVGV
jgi:hypothetical protein